MCKKWSEYFVLLENKTVSVKNKTEKKFDDTAF